MAEFALIAPVLALLLSGLAFAALLAFRSAASDWGVFIAGAKGGAYGSAPGQPFLPPLPWRDLSDGIRAESLSLSERAVRAQANVRVHRTGIFGVRVLEIHEATAFFRWWRFYPGPPDGGVH